MSLEDFNTKLQAKLEPWINNPPNFTEMKEAYLQQGKYRSAIRLRKREIERVEEQVMREVERPRSNDAKRIRNNSTTELKDSLAVLEAELEVIESEIKALEFMKTMFNAANYRTRLTLDS